MSTPSPPSPPAGAAPGKSPGAAEPLRKRRVVVIGAGIAGLTAAGVLQFQGCDVTVLEAVRGDGGGACGGALLQAGLFVGRPSACMLLCMLLALGCEVFFTSLLKLVLAGAWALGARGRDRTCPRPQGLLPELFRAALARGAPQQLCLQYWGSRPGTMRP